jgi:hypothetical protein
MDINFLPQIKKCPCCKVINIIKINGVTYENTLQLLSGWILKKIFNCRGCKVELGLFSHGSTKEKKLVWMDFIKCENSHYNDLYKLQKIKNDLNEQQKNIIENDKIIKKYYDVVKKITYIQNKIRLDQAKLKIKVKIEKRTTSIRNVF